MIEKTLKLNYGTFKIVYDPLSGVWKLSYSAPGLAYNLGLQGTGYAGIFRFGEVPIKIYENVEKGLELFDKMKTPEDWEKWKKSLKNGDQQSLVRWLASYLKQYEDAEKIIQAMEQVLEETRKKYGARNEGIFRKLNETIQSLEAKYREIQAKKQEIISKVKEIAERLRPVIEEEKNKYPQAYRALVRYLSGQKPTQQTETAGTQAAETAGQRQAVSQIQVHRSILQVRVARPRPVVQRTRQTQPSPAPQQVVQRQMPMLRGSIWNNRSLTPIMLSRRSLVYRMI